MIFWKIAENVPKIRNQNATQNFKQKAWCGFTKRKVTALKNIIHQAGVLKFKRNTMKSYLKKNQPYHENVFDYLFGFNSIWVDNYLARKIRLGEKNVLTSYQNTKSFRWFIRLFTTHILMSLNGIFNVAFTYTGLKFSRLERCWTK